MIPSFRQARLRYLTVALGVLLLLAQPCFAGHWKGVGPARGSSPGYVYIDLDSVHEEEGYRIAVFLTIYESAVPNAHDIKIDRITQETAFDCITLDLSLGDRAGVEMLRHLWVVGCKAPIIIISGCDNETCNESAKVAESLKLNIWESIPKPVNLATLRASLERLKASREVSPADTPQADQISPA